MLIKFVIILNIYYSPRIVIINSLPFPTSLFTIILPLCFSIIFVQIANPRPVPTPELFVVNPAENIENVHWFLEQYPDFSLDDIRGELCPELRDSVVEKGCIQLLPGVHQSDGFFIARFVKRKKQA